MVKESPESFSAANNFVLSEVLQKFLFIPLKEQAELRTVEVCWERTQELFVEVVKGLWPPRATHILAIANYFPVSKNFHDFDHMAHDKRLFAIVDYYIFAEKFHRSLPQFSLSEPMPSVHGQFCQSDDKFSYFSQDGLEANVTVE